jgi:hypothetical protein
MAQYNNQTRSLRDQNSSNYEVYMQADKFGQPADWRPDFTSKNRLKMSQPQTMFFNTFGTEVNDDTWSTVLTGTGVDYLNNNATEGGADPADYDPDTDNGAAITEKAVVMRVSAAGDKVERQTNRVIPYVPGKEQFLTVALRFDTPTTGIRRRAGLFDMQNGAYFEDTGVERDGEPTSYDLVVRKNGEETQRVRRADWNGDPLDGTGRSGIIADSLKQQLVGIEYEWYGTGMIRFGYVIDNELHVIHTVYNANKTVGTWARSPFLPIRLELEALNGQTETQYNSITDSQESVTLPTYAGGPAYFYQSSSSVIAEGGIEELGVVYNFQSGLSVNSGVGGTVPDDTVAIEYQTGNVEETHFKPILSIKLKQKNLDAVAIPIGIQVASPANVVIAYHLVKNATLTGSNFILTGVNHSAVVCDESSTEAIYDPSQIIFSGLAIQGSNYIEIPRNAQSQLGRMPSPDFDSLESDIITIVASISSGAANKRVIASLTWIEQP